MTSTHHHIQCEKTKLYIVQLNTLLAMDPREVGLALIKSYIQIYMEKTLYDHLIILKYKLKLLYKS